MAGLRGAAHDLVMRAIAFSMVVLFAVPASAGDITVRVVGDSDTRLEEATVGPDASVRWETACVAPCFTHVAPHALVRANAALASEPLELGSRDAIVRVVRGQAGAATPSNVLIGVGASLLASGGVAAPVAAVAMIEESFCFFGACHRDQTPTAVFAGAVITAAVGLVMLTAGLVIRPSARAHVSLALGSAAPQITF